MTILRNIDELEIVLRSMLIAQSGLPERFVRNSLSIHGEELNKVLSEQIYDSIDTTDCMMLFELRTRKNDSDMSETEYEDVVSLYSSYTLHVIIYGDNSTNIANNLVSRIRTQVIRQFLQMKGIYMESVSEPDRLNEYINETMWVRTDISIDVSCQIRIEQISEDISFDKLNDIIVKYGG